MHARPIAFFAIAAAGALVLGCAVVAPKSRIEPQERVAVEIRSAPGAGLTEGPDARAPDVATCLEGNRGNAEFARPICRAIVPVLASADSPAAAVPRLNEALAPLVEERELQTRFAEVVTSRLARRRSIMPTVDRADTLLAIRLHAVEVTLHDEGAVALRITAAARVETAGEDPRKARTAWRAVEHETHPRPFREWTDSDGRATLESLDIAIAAIADAIVIGATRAGERPVPRE